MVRNIKKFNLIIIVIFFFFFLIQFFPIIYASQSPTVEWNRRYGGNDYDIATKLIQTNDMGYIIAGITKSFGSGNQDFWLVKANENGTMEWNKAYGGLGEDFAYSLIKTDNNGFAIAGSTTSFDSHGDYDFLLIKTNESGSVEWYKTYGTLADDQATSLLKTKDGGYVIGGITNSSNTGYDFFLVKIDLVGTIQWSKTYDCGGEEKLWSLIQTQDDGFVFGGSTTFSVSGKSDMWIVKTDRNGAMLWNKTFGGLDEDSLQSIIEIDDMGFILAGETKSYGSGSYDIWLVKIDNFGAMKWNRTYGSKGEDTAQSIIKTSDDGFVIGGYSEVDLYYDFLLIKTDTNGYVQWSKNFHFGNDEKAFSLLQTNDGNYVVAGYSQSRDGYDIFMMKTNNSNLSNDNLYPVAYAGDDISTNIGKKIIFNGSGFDPDGEIINFKWDFNGDGIYDYESNINETIDFSFNKTGTYHAYFEIEDNNGSTSTDMCNIFVHPIFQKNENSYIILFLQIFVIFIALIVLFVILKKTNIIIKHNFLFKIKNKFNFLYKLNRWTLYLIISFLIITVLKILFSFIFSTPYIYTDELNYGVMANNIFHGEFIIMGRVPFYPLPTTAGYSYFLAPAYLLGNNIETVYHGMLAINCILSSLLIFPVFFIMRYFVNYKLSFITSIFIAITPAILVHNFQLMSENAFYLVFLISCLFLIKLYTYKQLNAQFFILSLCTGCIVGFLIMIRPTGIAMFAALFILIIYKLIKNRNISSLKYCLVFLPFLPAIFYLFFIEKKTISDYPISSQVENLSFVFSNLSNLTRFIHVILNEISYFILMSYIILMVFVIFLIIHWKEFSVDKKRPLSIFILYGLFSIFFLIILTTNHIYWIPEYNIYSRYVSPGLPIIIMLGIIGIDLFNKIKNRTTILHLCILFILLGLFVVFIFPTNGIKIVNNMDLIWIKAIQKYLLFGFNGFLLLKLIIGSILIIFSYYLIYLLFFKKNIKTLMKSTNPYYLIFILIILSLVVYYPSASMILDENKVATNRGINEPAQWLMHNDPDAIVIMEDSYAAFSGGGMDPAYWRFMYADMNFWFLEGKVIVSDKYNLSNLFLKEINVNYIVSTHDLTNYYQSVSDFYMNIEPMKRQEFVDWHIYRVN